MSGGGAGAGAKSTSAPPKGQLLLLSKCEQKGVSDLERGAPRATQEFRGSWAAVVLRRSTAARYI